MDNPWPWAGPGKKKETRMMAETFEPEILAYCCNY